MGSIPVGATEWQTTARYRSTERSFSYLLCVGQPGQCLRQLFLQRLATAKPSAKPTRLLIPISSRAALTPPFIVGSPTILPSLASFWLISTALYFVIIHLFLRFSELVFCLQDTKNSTCDHPNLYNKNMIINCAVTTRKNIVRGYTVA